MREKQAIQGGPKAGRQTFDCYLEDNCGRLDSLIHELWVARDREVWAKDPYYSIRLATVALSRGQVVFAQDIVEEALHCFPGNVELVRILARVSARRGSLTRARDLLVGLMKRGHQDAETLVTLAGVYREMWTAEQRSSGAHPFLIRSKNLFIKAFLESRDCRTGVDAASMSLLAGDREAAKRLAHQVLTLSSEEKRIQPENGIHLTGAVAEACVLLERRKDAIAYFARTKKLIGTQFDELASVRRRLRLLQDVSTTAAEILPRIQVPPIVGFVAYPDHGKGRVPPWRQPSFPPLLADEVSKRMLAVLEARGCRIGYASAAGPLDVLFLETLQVMGGESNSILPFSSHELFEPGDELESAEWRHRAERALAKCDQVEEASSVTDVRVEVLHSLVDRLVAGRTILRSRELETLPVLLTVSHAGRPRSKRGEGELIQEWRRLGFPVEVIDVRAAAETAGIGSSHERLEGRRKTRRPERRPGNPEIAVFSILAADLVGFSRLTEDQIPAFIQGFVGAVAERIAALRREPAFKNLWGDGLCFAFTECNQAAEAALELRDMVRETDWRKLGLPEDLSLRIVLHTGPAYLVAEPLLGRETLAGDHVNHAALLESVVPSGNVYSSEQFAALLATSGADSVECRHVGTVVLPGGRGIRPIYHVRRKHELE